MAKFSLYDLPMDVLYPNKPEIKSNNWEKWLELCSNEEKELISNIRNSYADIEKLGICIIEVVEPISLDGTWIEQYPYDYVRQKHPELTKLKIPHFIIVYKMDKNLHLDKSRNGIECQIYNLTEGCKKKFAEYVFIHFPRQFVYFENAVWFIFTSSKLYL